MPEKFSGFLERFACIFCILGSYGLFEMPNAKPK